MAILAVARLTAQHTRKQPLTWLVLAVAVVMVLLSYFFGLFSFEVDRRLGLLISAGIAVNLLHTTFLSCYSVSASIHDELSSRTALTLFAKPMSRTAFLLGKILGVLTASAGLSLLITLAHLAVVTVAASKGFDLQDHNPWLPETAVPWGALILGHGLAWISAATLTHIAAVCALRLSLTLSLVVTFGAFVLAQLLGGLGLGSAYVLPNLSLFQIEEALTFSDMPVTPLYFALSLGHAALYSVACLLIGSALFSHQDIP